RHFALSAGVDIGSRDLRRDRLAQREFPASYVEPLINAADRLALLVAFKLGQERRIADVALEPLDLELAGGEGGLLSIVQVAFLGLGLGDDGAKCVGLRRARLTK